MNGDTAELTMRVSRIWDFQGNEIHTGSLIRDRGSKSFELDEKNCGTGAGGFKPGNTCAGPHSNQIAVKDAQGNFEPGTVGAHAGIDTKNWEKYHNSAQWAMAKIHSMEKAAKAGDWEKLAKLKYTQYANFSKLHPYTQAAVAAHTNLMVKHGNEMIGMTQKVQAAPPAEWKKVGGKLGTEEGGVYEFKGEKYYVKQPKDEARLDNELLALKLYELVGTPAKTAEKIQLNGKPALALKWVDSQSIDWKNPNPDIKIKAQEDFAVHAWLNNWDVVGAGSEKPMDNLHLHNGKVTMMDAGGALQYSGMGGSGKKLFTKEAHEFNTLRDPLINPTAAQVFGSMTAQQLVDSAQKLKNITNNQIAELVMQYGPKDSTEKLNISGTLIARRLAILAEVDKLEGKIKAEAHAKMLAAVPPPPPVTNKTSALWDPDYQKIYKASQTGDVKNVEAIKTNPNSGHYYEKLHKYKLAVISAMTSGGTAQASHVIPKSSSAPPKTPTVQSPQAPPTPKVDPSKFPKKPVFKDANYAVANDAVVAKALEYANKGDLQNLKNTKVENSGKYNTWHNELVSVLTEQLHPKVPPKSLNESIHDVVSMVDLASPAAKDKFGHYLIHDDFGGVPQGIPKSVSWNDMTSSQQNQLWSSGETYISGSGAKTIAKSYTGSGYGSLNGALRDGKTNTEAFKNAKKLGDAILKGPDLPIGLLISRGHNGNNDYAKFKEGMVISEKGFMSTSVSSGYGGQVSLKLTVGPGVKGLPAKNFSNYPSEDEVILPPSQKMLITKIEEKKTSYSTSRVIHAVLLPSNPAQCC